MNRRPATAQRRSFQVVLWTIGWTIALQGLAALLPGYPWPSHTQPEVAVRTERYYRYGGWIRTSPTPEESIIQWQVHHLLTDVPPQDVVFVGDSSCLMGIVPQRIMEQTGLPAWNLGTVGSMSTHGHARILELYLQRNSSTKPKLIVSYFAPPTLLRTSEQVAQLGVFNRFQEWLHGTDAGQAAQAPLAQLPGYRLRRPLYAAAGQLLGDESRPTPVLNVKRGPFPSDDSIRETLLKNRGYLPEPRRRTKLQVRELQQAPMPTADSLVGIVHMFKLAQAYSVDLLFVMTPLPESYRTPEIEQTYRDLEERLRQAARPYPKVQLSAPLLRYYSDEDFGTLDHLSEQAAPKNSDDIAGLIERTLR